MMQLRRNLSTLHFKKIVERIFPKIKRGSFQTPDSYGIVKMRDFGHI